MNIQEAINSGKPFRRKGWVDDEIYIVYSKNDIALTLESDFCTSIELDVQDILANDWYTRENSATPMRRNMQTSHTPVNRCVPVNKFSFSLFSILMTQKRG